MCDSDDEWNQWKEPTIHFSISNKHLFGANSYLWHFIFHMSNEMVETSKEREKKIYLLNGRIFVLGTQRWMRSIRFVASVWAHDVSRWQNMLTENFNYLGDARQEVLLAIEICENPISFSIISEHIAHCQFHFNVWLFSMFQVFRIYRTYFDSCQRKRTSPNVAYFASPLLRYFQKIIHS